MGTVYIGKSDLDPMRKMWKIAVIGGFKGDGFAENCFLIGIQKEKTNNNINDNNENKFAADQEEIQWSLIAQEEENYDEAMLGPSYRFGHSCAEIISNINKNKSDDKMDTNDNENQNETLFDDGSKLYIFGGVNQEEDIGNVFCFVSN